MELSALVFVAIGIFILMTDPSEWMLGAAVVALFGAGAVLFALAIRTKGRTPEKRGALGFFPLRSCLSLLYLTGLAPAVTPGGQ